MSFVNCGFTHVERQDRMNCINRHMSRYTFCLDHVVCIPAPTRYVTPCSIRGALSRDLVLVPAAVRPPGGLPTQILPSLTHPQEYLEDVLRHIPLWARTSCDQLRSALTLLYSRDAQRCRVHQGATSATHAIPFAASGSGVYPAGRAQFAASRHALMVVKKK